MMNWPPLLPASVQSTNPLGPGLDIEVEPDITDSLETGLVTFWPGNEVSGTRRARYGSSLDHLLETGGSVGSAAGPFGLAVDSVKTNTQYLMASFTPRSFDAGFTMAIWVYLKTVPPNDPGGIFVLKNSAGDDWIWLARYYDGNGVEFGFRSPGGVSTSAAIPVLPSEETWHFITAWWDPTSLKAEMQVNNGGIYNREFGVASTTIDITGWDFDEVYLVGGNTTPFHGRAAAATLYERVLSGVERERLYSESRETISVNPFVPAHPLPHVHGVGDVVGLEAVSNGMRAVPLAHAHTVGEIADLRPDDSQWVLAQRMYGG